MSGLIILGTASDSGKSMICTALCRILADEQVQVAPFKSQNLSPFTVTLENGIEISRAQYIQALAARTKPTLYMNPIMVKPSSPMHTEVSILGGHFGIRDGFAFRDMFFDQAVGAIRHSLKKLSEKYESVIIEGAGSPAEVNLNDREIVNMRVAEMADVPALLVADIDRGGAIASIVGTLQLLEPEHRARVKGIIVNKFHGDIAFFRDGIEFIESYTGIPVVGVIPFKEDHGIEEEDMDRPISKAPAHLDRYDAWAEHVKNYLNWPLVKEIIAQGVSR
ncbi:cobyric acid synthase [Sporosarcina pasteurii]|uniref:Cobyric acid synthase n=1 Tax=Sporosarcina pasteurii TaxID=1474 RepID=A0A380BCK5_SPOPA|nr:cobyric acid synthase [Sporosarcina pasteurii]MDS9472313.1 cobyric acid synthase [Sporosarcina pasteurii]QBQ06293.1 cobyric acid synthase [Sporosarcina pasteurii]SUI99065.1 Cobyric acid synthase [Sporosarcina pasteurii]